MSVSKSRVMKTVKLSGRESFVFSHTAGQRRERTGDQILVKSIHRTYVFILDFETADF
jgi:hypothetical protein